MSNCRILALDLSLTATGWCLDGETGLIKPKTRGMERLDNILTDVLDTWRDRQPDVVVIEGYSFGSQGRSVYQIGELGGVVRREFWRRRIPFIEVPPSTLKKYTTGKGNANKDAMLAAAIRRFGFAGVSNDEADAFLLWCMAMDAYGLGQVTVPKLQRAALDAVEWPVLEVEP